MMYMMDGRSALPTVLLNFLLQVATRGWILTASGAPSSPTDVFKSPCPLMTDPPPAGFKLWSSPVSWPGGRVPGVGPNSGSNVTIPCGTAVLLDVPNLNVGLLQIKGFLKFKDDPSLPAIYVKANFVLVEGQLTIGTPTQQFRQKATIELTPNTRNNRASLKFSSFPPADPTNPRDFGHKAFVVVGGQLHLHGLPSNNAAMPVWCKLRKTANRGETAVTVDTNVEGSWKVGSTIVVASTDYDMSQAEEFKITKVVSATANSAVLSLDKSLKFMHFGDAKGIPDGFGGYVDQRAEVALMSRNIVIKGTDEPAPFTLEGGHFMVFMTAVPQFIEGTVFTQLGQQGVLGRYSVHFHVNGNTPGTVFRKNAVHHSKQRCVVIHASHNMTIESTVAFNSSGHCYMVEDGGETGNTFLNNLGILTKAAVKLIPTNVNAPSISEETDNSPSTFWISNPNNNFIGNAASGSDDSGFWVELRESVRGASQKIPSLKGILPINSKVGTYLNNVAHSNLAAGVRTYPHGMLPRNSDWSGSTGVFSGFNAYKNSVWGMFVHNTDNLIITNATLSDNSWGIYMNQLTRVRVKNSRFVALSKNFGNPTQCFRTDSWAPCRPVSGCSLPVLAGQQSRSAFGFSWKAPTLGVVMDQGNRSDNGLMPISVESVSFSNYNSTCTNSSAIALLGPGKGDFWNPSQSVQALNFSSNSNKIWAVPKYANANPWLTTEDPGEQGQFYTLYDKDGSIIGKPGFVVINNKKILPPQTSGCTFMKSWNAYGCPGTCYRTVEFSFYEPGFQSGPKAALYKTGMYSQLSVTRVSDGQQFNLTGNLNQVFDYGQDSNVQRFFAMTLLAGQTYRMKVVPGYVNPGFLLSNITLKYKDNGCKQGLTIQLPPFNGKVWKSINGGSLHPKLCEGATAANLSDSSQISSVCLNSQSWLSVEIGVSVQTPVSLVATTGSTACSALRQCGLLWGGSSEWLYDTSGLDLRPSFYNPLGSTVGWKKGTAPMGSTTWGSKNFRTILPPPSSSRLVYYFRKSFNIKDSACFTAFKIDVTVLDGVVLYLNNKEVLRSNMPAGPIKNTTLALSDMSFPSWKTFSIPLPGPNGKYDLVEGLNFVAVEQHFAHSWTFQPVFDLEITAVRRDVCTGPRKSIETCDGLDNDYDGLVDEGPDGKPLNQTCKTACGVGVSTCVKGAFQSCTARSPSKEKCNGIDDDCDGLVDNGFGQLDCPVGNMCSRGKCLPVIAATVSQRVWPQNSSGWFYYDKGGNLDATNPDWRKGSMGVGWKGNGKGPLGWDTVPAQQSWDKFGTVINNFGNDGTSITGYFLKSFNLTSADIASIYSLFFNVRRVDGAVIFVNGAEVWRSGMPSGNIHWKTMAADIAQVSGNFNLQWAYNAPDDAITKPMLPLKAGTNWIAAELHLAYNYEAAAAFDMDLYRNNVASCPSSSGTVIPCVRTVSQRIILPLSSWDYSDYSLPTPTNNWMLPSYNSSKWKNGVGPLGFSRQNKASWMLKTNISIGPLNAVPRAFYFRKTINVANSACFHQLQANLLANDGAVVYINGIEAYRFNVPVGSPASQVFASYGGNWGYHQQNITGGWLKSGNNVVAIQLSRAAATTDNIFFDFQLMGHKEAITCK